MCSDEENCFTKEIAAPIYGENSNCHLNWKGSEYMLGGASWQPVTNTGDNESFVVAQVSGYYKLKVTQQ